MKNIIEVVNNISFDVPYGKILFLILATLNVMNTQQLNEYLKSVDLTNVTKMKKTTDVDEIIDMMVNRIPNHTGISAQVYQPLSGVVHRRLQLILAEIQAGNHNKEANDILDKLLKQRKSINRNIYRLCNVFIHENNIYSK